MRGTAPSHSGRTKARGPAAGAGIKWTFANDSGHSPVAYESIPAVTASGLVLAAATYGNGAASNYLHALDVETGTLRWNASINGSVWASVGIITLISASCFVCTC